MSSRRNDYTGKAGISNEQAEALRIADALCAMHARYDDEDMKQEARAAALEALGTYNGAKGASRATWVHLRVRGAVADYCTRELTQEQARSGHAQLEDWAAADEDDDTGAIDRLSYAEPPDGYEVPGEASRSDSDERALAHLEAALSRLPEEQRIAIRLNYGMDGDYPMSRAQIAGRLGLPESTIKKRLEHAHALLKRFAKQGLT